MKKIVCLVCLVGFVGCATRRYALRDLQEYNSAMMLAERNGIDTSAMHVEFMAMMDSYLHNPQEDPLVRAARKSADASMVAAISTIQIPQPAPYVPPLTFNQWRGR